jgi:hypothetical protein
MTRNRKVSPPTARSHPSSTAPGAAVRSSRLRWVAVGAICCLLGGTAVADEPAEKAPPDDAAALAQKLQNPVASLISVPIQSNWDFGIGPADAMRYTVNVQPVMPFSLTRELNLIVRTILPIIHAEATAEGGEAHSGTGDILQSFFVSPKEPVLGWIMGGGPALLYPSASDDALGSEKWGLGPTVVLLRQQKGWTYGLLANHVWSYAGASDRSHVNSTFLQPFLSYTNAMHTSFVLNTESTYDWAISRWTVPLNPLVSQVLKVGGVPLSIGLGARYYATRPAGGPDWGLRFVVTLLFPR